MRGCGEFIKEPSPGADGENLQQTSGCHLEGGAELRHAGLLQQLEWLPQHGLRPTQLGQNVEQTARDRQGDVHGLISNAQCKDRHQ